MNRKTELLEAKQAIEITLYTIDEARAELKSARSVGWWDIFGGGMFVSLFKRHKMNKANDVFKRLQYQVSVLKRELNDVNMTLPDGPSSNGFEYAFDVFFDNVFVDFMVQSDIKRSMVALDELEEQLLSFLNQIDYQLSHS